MIMITINYGNPPSHNLFTHVHEHVWCCPHNIYSCSLPGGGGTLHGVFLSPPKMGGSGPPQKCHKMWENGQKWPKWAQKWAQKCAKSAKKCTFAQKSKFARFSVAFEGRQDFKKGVVPLFGPPDCSETGGKFSGNFRILGGSPKPHILAKNGQNRRFWTPPGPKFFPGPPKNGSRKVTKYRQNTALFLPPKMGHFRVRTFC